MSVKNAVITAAAIIIVGLAGIFLAVGYGFIPPAVPSGASIPEYPGEVLFYKGENLTSISDTGIVYYDGNRIINESDYRLTVTGLVNRTIVYTYGDILAHGTSKKL